MTPADQLREQIATLKEALISANPGMPTMLRTIHTALQKDKDIVTLLSEEEIGVVVAGLLKQTNTVITAAKVKKPSSKLSLDDLM